MTIYSQILGWFGTLLILFAYFLVSFKKIDVYSRKFQLMNLIGALTLGVHVYYKKIPRFVRTNFPSFILEEIGTVPTSSRNFGKLGRHVFFVSRNSLGRYRFNRPL